MGGVTEGPDEYEASLAVASRISGTTVPKPVLLFDSALAVCVKVPVSMGGKVPFLSFPALEGTTIEGWLNGIDAEGDSGGPLETSFEGFAESPDGLGTGKFVGNFEGV